MAVGLPRPIIPDPLTLGDMRLRAWASTSWAVASFSVLGGWGNSAGSMSGTSSTLKRGCQRVSWSSGTTMGGFREARKACVRRRQGVPGDPGHICVGAGKAVGLRSQLGDLGQGPAPELHMLSWAKGRTQQPPAPTEPVMNLAGTEAAMLGSSPQLGDQDQGPRPARTL